ncbi:MAG: bifunctional oligoribonuclease/PAP phosphatase NrnA [Clostridia bacterium]|nr:bifunctional oligoribonuclease/PAP phosphatase NrnA [Clostridia bacterium]
MKVTFDTVCEFLRSNDNFIILTHRAPDGDTLGSAYALERVLRKTGKTAYVKNCDPVPKKYMFLSQGAADLPEGFAPGFIIAVDVAENAMLGALAPVYEGKVDLCIDHHISNSDYARSTYVDADAAATAEIIFGLLKALNVSLDTEIAKLIYTAIVTDTGSFKFSNTTPHTLMTAAELISMDFDFNAIQRELFDLKTFERLELEKLVLSTLKLYEGGSVAVIHVTDEMLIKSGTTSEDMDGLAQIPRNIEGVRVGITMKQSGENGWRVSMRSSDVNVSEVCKCHGGGGHPRAAGCEVDGGLSEARESILSTIRRFMQKKDA